MPSFKYSLMLGLLALGLPVLFLVTPGDAFAQDVVEPTESQRKLNEAGVQQLIAEDFDAAIASFQSALALGELNITLINLGRAYQKAGECQKAADTWDQIPGAPVVPNPSPEELASVLARYQKELADCKGALSFSCNQEGIQIEAGGQAMNCSGLFESTGGTVELTATWQDQEKQLEVMIPADGSTQTVDIEFEPPKEDEPDKTVIPPDPPPQPVTHAPQTPWLKIFGWSSVGVGGALLVTFLAVNYGAIAPKFDELEDMVDEPTPNPDEDQLRSDIQDLQTANIAILGVGSTFVLTGAILLIVDAATDDDVPGDTTAWFDGQSGGVGYRITW